MQATSQGSRAYSLFLVALIAGVVGASVGVNWSGLKKTLSEGPVVKDLAAHFAGSPSSSAKGRKEPNKVSEPSGSAVKESTNLSNEENQLFKNFVDLAKDYEKRSMLIFEIFDKKVMLTLNYEDAGFINPYNVQFQGELTETERLLNEARSEHATCEQEVEGKMSDLESRLQAVRNAQSGNQRSWIDKTIKNFESWKLFVKNTKSRVDLEMNHRVERLRNLLNQLESDVSKTDAGIEREKHQSEIEYEKAREYAVKGIPYIAQQGIGDLHSQESSRLFSRKLSIKSKIEAVRRLIEEATSPVHMHHNYWKNNQLS